MNTFGLRAHDFGSFDSIELFTHRIMEYTPISIQLAIPKLLTPYKSYKDIDSFLTNKITRTLNKNNINTAIISCYINPVHPNTSIREKQYKEFERALTLSNTFECPYVGTETGSRNFNNEYDINTFSNKTLTLFYHFLDKMLPIAQKNKAIIAIEPVANKHTICSLEKTANMLSKFQCDNLKIIYDSVNLIEEKGIREKNGNTLKVPSYEAQKKFHSDILAEIGKDIIALHIKDFSVDNYGKKIGDLAVGDGIMNYKALFDSLHEYNINVPRILEMVHQSNLNFQLKYLKGLDSI